MDIRVILSLVGLTFAFSTAVLGVVVRYERRFAKLERDVAELRTEICTKVDLFWGFVQKNVDKMFPGTNPNGILLAKLSAGTLSKQESVILEKQLADELYCKQSKYPLSLLFAIWVLNEHKKHLFDLAVVPEKECGIRL